MGLNLDMPSLRKKAVGISNMVRHFNLREGMTIEDDKLPPKLHCELSDTGKILGEHELKKMRRDYYQLRGWDASGRLTEKLFDFDPLSETVSSD
jgi:aldehyde:ferredoxin oxidoreductase